MNLELTSAKTMDPVLDPTLAKNLAKNMDLNPPLSVRMSLVLQICIFLWIRIQIRIQPWQKVYKIYKVEKYKDCQYCGFFFCPSYICIVCQILIINQIRGGGCCTWRRPSSMTSLCYGANLRQALDYQMLSCLENPVDLKFQRTRIFWRENSQILYDFLPAHSDRSFSFIYER